MLREPLNKPESSATRLLLRLSLLDPGPPKSPQSSRGLVQKFLRQGLLVIVGLLYLCSFKPARADLMVCNLYDRSLDVSVGYHKSDNDAWTAIGHHRLEDTSCLNILSFDLNEEIYIYAQDLSDNAVHGYAVRPDRGENRKQYFCVDKGVDYETVWDGDENIAYYKDLLITSSTPRFTSCKNLTNDSVNPRSNYEQMLFHYVTGSTVSDHCLVTLISGSFARTDCWD